MTEDPREGLDDLLDAAICQLTDVPGGDQPPADLNDAILRRVTRSGDLTRERNQPRNKEFTTAMKYGLAASILATVASVIGVFEFLGGHSTLYAQVAQRIEQLSSLVCRVQWAEDVRLDDMDRNTGKTVTYLAPSRYRIEDTTGDVHIIDTENNREIYLNPKTKEAMVMQGQDVAMASLFPVTLVKTLREHFHSDRVGAPEVRELGRREIDGILATGLRSALNGQVVETWVDPATHLPLEVRIRLVLPSHLAGGKTSSMWYVMSDFQYDIEVDKTLMAMKVPEGYTEISVPPIPVDRSQATLGDLIAMLRVCAKHNDSRLPLSLSMKDDEGTCMAIMKQYAARFDQDLASGSGAQRKAALKAVTEFGAVLGRGTAFLFTIKEENDLHYFGGARLNDPNRPLLWFSPDGDSNYTVVYADLSVKDATADTLPTEPVQAAVDNRARPSAGVAAAAWPSPTLELPSQAIRDYASLQASRTQGKQKKVQYLVLAWMPEFLNSPPVPGGVVASQPQAIAENWKPEIGPESNRLAFLNEFPNLKGLKVDHLYLTQNDLDAIAQCTKLEQLSLSGVHVLEETSRRLSGADLQKLRTLTNLEELDLGQANFVGGLHWLGGLPHLKKLYLGSFEHLNDQSIAELQALPHLEVLLLAAVYGTSPETSVTDAGLLSLQRLPKVRTLYVGWHGRWTLPVEKLQQLLPEVEIKAGN